MAISQPRDAETAVGLRVVGQRKIKRTLERNQRPLSDRLGRVVPLAFKERAHIGVVHHQQATALI